MKLYIALSIVILCIQLSPYSSLKAQEEESMKVISLHDAIETALKNNYDYKIALNDQKASKEMVNETWGQLFPILNSQATMIKQYAEMGQMSLSKGQYDIKVVQMSFGVNPGSFYNSLQAAKKGYKSAIENTRHIRNDITYKVIESYFSVLVSEETIDLIKSSIKFLEENLHDVENQFKTGSVPKYDLLQARVKLQSQEPLLIEAISNHKVSLENFNYLLGEEGVRFTADHDELNRPMNPVTEKKEDVRIADLTEEALKNRPEIIMIQMKKESAIDKKDIYQSMYLWPILSVGGYWGYNKNFVKSLEIPAPFSSIGEQILGNRDWQQNWAVSIAATYRWGSLFPFDTNKVKEREEELSVKKAEMELYQLKRAISISIKSSFYKLVASYDKMRSNKENMVTAEEQLRIAKESFKSGVIKNSDLLAAQYSLITAKTGYINAINMYYVSLANLQKETGIDDEQLIIQGE